MGNNFLAVCFKDRENQQNENGCKKIKKDLYTFSSFERVWDQPFALEVKP